MLLSRLGHQCSEQGEALCYAASVSQANLIPLCAWQHTLYSRPDIIDGDRLHTHTIVAGLHLSQEKTWFPCWMSPESNMFRIVKGIGSIFLGAGWSKDSYYWYTHSSG